MRVAITGGIGSGKSVVLSILRDKGYNCISSDEINKSLLESPIYIKKIDENFPGAVRDNKIDKKMLSSIIFNNESKLKLLNSIAHPEIRRISNELSSKTDISFVEVPLLFEAGFEDDYDKIIVVSANLEKRIERVKQRDNRSEEEIKSIISNQIKSYEGKKIDFIINNNDDINFVAEEVNKFLKSQLK